MPEPVEPPTPPGLTIDVVRDDDATVVAARGEIDVATVERFREAATRALVDTDAPVRVDLAQCTFVDSSALQVLIVLRQSLARAGRTLTVTPGPPQVQRVFEISGLSDDFQPADAGPGAG